MTCFDKQSFEFYPVFHSNEMSFYFEIYSVTICDCECSRIMSEYKMILDEKHKALPEIMSLPTLVVEIPLFFFESYITYR